MKNFKEKLPHIVIMLICVVILILAAITVAWGQNEKVYEDITSTALNANPNNAKAFGLLIVVLSGGLFYSARQGIKKDEANQKKDSQIISMTENFQKILTDTIQGNTAALQAVNNTIGANDDKIISAMKEITMNNERHMTTVLKEILHSHENNVRNIVSETVAKYFQK